MDKVQMCTVHEIIGGKPCLRLAQWCWETPWRDPVFLCNHHAEPLNAEKLAKQQ